MPGAILQLVANSGAVQNLWIDHDPQITFFKKIYRRYTPFATELIPLQFKTPIDFGKSGTSDILPYGDLVHRMFFVFDIPELSAVFLNTKSKDIATIINELSISDNYLLQLLKEFVMDNDKIEFDRILNLIDDTIKNYDVEEQQRLNILNMIEQYIDKIEPEEIPETYVPKLPIYDVRLESDSYIQVLKSMETKYHANNQKHDYDFNKFKMQLTNKWIGQKKEYFLIYELLKFIYLSEKNVIENVPLVDTNQLFDSLLHGNILYDLIPNPEIQCLFYLTNSPVFNIRENKNTGNIIGSVESYLLEQHQITYPKKHFYNNINHLYNLTENCIQINNPNFLNNPIFSNTYNCLKNSENKTNLLENYFYDFGPNFNESLGLYNSIIDSVKKLATTVPIVIAKAFTFHKKYDIMSNPEPCNIYHNPIGISTINNHLPTIIDPNFKAKFLSPTTLIEQDTWQQCGTLPNAYLKIFNKQSNEMFDRIQIYSELLYESYWNKLFSSTDKLFYNNSPPITNIYGYIVPTTNFIDDENLRIKNVFNANIWFFYFFKYLDALNVSSFAEYVKNNIIRNISPNGVSFIKHLLTILKINIEYYMNEISYLLNDLYATSPSIHPSDNMKNYVPSAHGEEIDGVNIHHDLLAVTLIFHRNHVPTILEMFQFIYHFISTIEINKINIYLDTHLDEIKPSERTQIRNITKLLYYHIFKYFMDVYDSFHFEAAANFSTEEYDVNDNIAINKYVQLFLKGIPIQTGPMISVPTFFPEGQVGSKPMISVPTTYEQISLIDTISQMEFYFVSEMMVTRELQKLYHNCLFNKQYILENIGSTCSELVDTINKTIIVTDKNYQPDISKFDNSYDSVRNYWDEMYQHNAKKNDPDNLYYNTFDINRFSGEAYLYTPYQSRNYDCVPKIANDFPLLPPIPLPPINPYGINSTYYNHMQHTLKSFTRCQEFLETKIPVYWINVESKTEIISTLSFDKSKKFELFNIDYLRIKHEIFFKNHITIPNNIKFIDEYQFNLLKFIKLTKRLNDTHPLHDKKLFDLLFDTAFFLANHISSEQILLDKLYLFMNHISTCDKTLLSRMISEQMYDIAVNIFTNYQNLYTYNDMVTNNIYTYNQILNINPQTNKNIIDKLTIARNNYLSQYFYYVKHQDSIAKINYYSCNSDQFKFKNISQILKMVMSSINKNNIDLSWIKNLSTNVFLYPDMFIKQIQKLVSLEHTLDDFSANILKMLATFLNPNSVARLTFKDVHDIINTTFWAVKEIYRYSLENKLFENVQQKLEIFQPLLLNKLLLFNEIHVYLTDISSCKFMQEQDIVNISLMAQKYGIDYSIFYNYIDSIIKPQYNTMSQFGNSGGHNIPINITLNSDLDYFFLKYHTNSNIYPGITFKKYFLKNILKPSYQKQHPILQTYFKYIDNEYYAFIYFLMNYAEKNNIGPIDIKNPLLLYTEQNMLDDHQYISKQYHSFSHISDVIQYFMDLIWDYSISLCGYDPFLNTNQLEYGMRFSSVINELHYDNKKMDTIDHPINHCSTSAHSDKIENIIKILNQKQKTLPLINLIENQPIPLKNNYFDGLTEKNNITELSKIMVKRGIVVINQYRNELEYFQNQIHNILYRNKKAKTAWVRKLAHFLVKEVTFSCGDEVGDNHISDWFESYHELSKKDGTDPGYNKMIGHREDLIIFNDEPKKSYTVIMPFIFYFNRNISLSVPLNASINTKYEINIRLRNLDEVTYKEEFSDFVNPKMNDLKPSIPKINKAHLMVEYIYLSSEERKIFASNILEYLVDELQYDNNFNISDHNLVPIYKVGNNKKSVTRIKNGVKKKEIYYDSYHAILTDKNTLDTGKYNTDLLPRNDYIPTKYTDRNGIEKMMMIHKPIHGIDPYIHQKRIELKNYFNHPTKLMIVMIKPLAHTDLSYRTNEKNYFFGEKQWDNYSLYSYYDLSKINDAKKLHCELMLDHLNNLEHPTFGFIGVINQVLLDYTLSPKEQVKFISFAVDFTDIPINNNKPVIPESSDNLTNINMDTWIKNNYEYFLEKIQQIKDAYNNYDQMIVYGKNMIKMKENLLSLNIDYDIIDKHIFFLMINDIYDKLGLPSPKIKYIKKIFKKILPNFSAKNMNMGKETFIIGITKLLSKEIKYTMPNQMVIQSINYFYQNYNEAKINSLINAMNKFFVIDGTEYNFKTIVSYFNNIYSATNTNKDIIGTIIQINNKIIEIPGHEINCRPVKNLTFKDVTHQILTQNNDSVMSNYINIVQHSVIKIISAKMNQKLNETINEYPVKLINYQKNMVLNPSINPLISGYLKFNGYNIMPENSNSIMWSEAKAYQYMPHTPSTGINLHSWSLNPLSNQPQGSANLSKIDEFMSVYYVHPLISDSYPAVIITSVTNTNITRYLSGMCGKVFNKVE